MAALRTARASLRRPDADVADWEPWWFARAACVGVPHEVFFGPDIGTRRAPAPGREATWDAEAKRICAGCDVRERCLAYALDNREEYGVWGGTNEVERAAILKRGALNGRH